MTASSTPQDVVQFWHDAGPQNWFAHRPAFDAEFRQRFLAAHHAAARRELDAWAAAAAGSLALLILLDQFPRNAFRGSGHMYATDALARHFARLALAAGHDGEIESRLRIFCYLPFAHSERIADQDLSLRLHRRLGDGADKHALQHRDVVLRFGRFPHRNRMLGRQTTAEELAFLQGGGFGG